jgi:hypothetical protein
MESLLRVLIMYITYLGVLTFGFDPRTEDSFIKLSLEFLRQFLGDIEKRLLKLSNGSLNFKR